MITAEEVKKTYSSLSKDEKLFFFCKMCKDMVLEITLHYNEYPSDILRMMEIFLNSETFVKKLRLTNEEAFQISVNFDPNFIMHVKRISKYHLDHWIERWSTFTSALGKPVLDSSVQERICYLIYCNNFQKLTSDQLYRLIARDPTLLNLAFRDGYEITDNMCAEYLLAVDDGSQDVVLDRNLFTPERKKNVLNFMINLAKHKEREQRFVQHMLIYLGKKVFDDIDELKELGDLLFINPELCEEQYNTLFKQNHQNQFYDVLSVKLKLGLNKLGFNIHITNSERVLNEI